MPKNKEKDSLELEATVLRSQRNLIYICQLDNGQEILGYLCGKMRQLGILPAQFDRVKLEVHPSDLSKGRITYRIK